MSISPLPNPQDRAETPGTLFFIALCAFLVNWVLAPAIYLLITGQAHAATSQPTTQSISPRDLVALSILMPSAGLISLIIGNAFWRDRGFEGTGVTLADLRRGWTRGLIAALIILPLMIGVVFLTQKLWDLLHYVHPNEHDLLRALGNETHSPLRIAIVISATVLAPLFEEFFFRGMIQRAVLMFVQSLHRRDTGVERWIAILVTSLAFTAVHNALWLAPPIFFLSLCLGYAYERTRNLWVPIIVHAAFNASSVVMFLFFR